MAERVGTFHAGLEVDRGAESKVSGQVKGIAKKAAGVFVAAFAVRGAFNFLKDSVADAGAAQAAQGKLADALERFPALAGTNIKALQGLNSELAKKTRFDDDATAAAQSQLAAFGLTGDQLKTLTPLVQDFAAKTGQDLGSAALGVGKALLGQGRSLKQVGINLKDTGSAAGNFEAVIGSLGAKVGGFAAKEGKTFAGQQAILANTFGELKESVGGALLPVLSQLASALLPVIEALGPVLTTAVETLAPILTSLAETIGPVLIPVIEQLAPFITQLAAAFGEILVALLPLLPSIVELVVALLPLIPPITQLIVLLVKSLVPVLKALIPPLVKVASFLVNVLIGAVKLVIGAIKGILRFFGRLISFGKEVVEKVTGFIGGIIQKFKDIAGNIIGGLVDGIKNGAKKVINAIKDFVLSKIPAFVKKFFGISSPSKLMAGFGRNIVEGMAVGITQGASAIPTALDRALRPVSIPSLAPFSVGGSSLAAAAGSTVTQTITVNEVANDPVATARAVAARVGMAATR